MSKTLRTLMRTGWTTKPAPDLPDNRLTAAEVDGNFLALEDQSLPVFRATLYGGVPGAETSQHAAIQAALDAAESAGGGRVVVDPGLWWMSESARVPSNIVLELLPGSHLKRLPPATQPCLTNKNHDTGNSNITVVGPGLVDGNREEGSPGHWFAVEWRNVHHSLFFNMRVRGASRYQPATLEADKRGDGMIFRQCTRCRVIGGRFFDNDYDAIKLRESFHCSIVGAAMDNNHRSGCQIVFDRDAFEALTEPSKYNVITGCTVTHPTGVVPVGGGSSVNSGFAMHSGSYNVIDGNTVYGTAHFIDVLEGGNYNRISNNVAFVRPQSATRSDRAAVILWDWNSTANVGNEICDNNLHMINGSAGRFIWLGRTQKTRFSGNRFYRGGGSGTWSVNLDNNSTNNEIDDIFPDGVSFSWGSGAGNTRFVRDGESLTFRKANGDVVDLLDVAPPADETAPTLTGATATATSATTASGAVTTNEGNGTLYWLASQNSTETAGTVKAAQSQAVVATGEQTVSVSGLTAETTYYMHFVHRDSAGNDSTVATSSSFATPEVSLDPDEEIIAAIEATDAGALSSTIKDAISAFYDAGVSGGWWSKMAAIYGFVGGTANSHGINWKNPNGTRVTWSGTLTHSANGVQGGGGYGDTGITAASSVARNDNSIGYYCNAQGANLTFEGIVGAGNSSAAGSFHAQQSSDNSTTARLSSASGTTINNTVHSPTQSFVVGHVLSQRTASSSAAIYKNNSALTLTASATSDAEPVSQNIRILSRGSDGPTFSGRLALAYWGESLDSSQRSSMHSAVVALQTALGRNV